MSHLLAFISKKICLGVAFVMLLLTTNFSLRAEINSSQLEIGAALTTMVVDMAANYYDYKKDSMKANVLKCATDTLSLSTKGLFLYNNKQSHADVGGWNRYDRDVVLNGALITRDVIKLAQHLYASLVKQEKIVDEKPEAIQAHVAAKKVDLKEEYGDAEKEKLALIFERAAFNRKVFIIPLFKGLTTLAMALTQRYTTRFSSDQHRFNAAALHCLSVLVEENENLATDSSVKKPLLFALCLNIAWVLFEGYKSNQETAVLAKKTNGGKLRFNRCPTHGANAKAMELDKHQGVCCCIKCAKSVIEEQRLDDLETDGVIYRFSLPGRPEIFADEENPNLTFSRNDVHVITNNDPKLMHHYDLAEFLDNAERPNEVIEQLRFNDRDYYEVLEVVQNATPQEITQAYREQARNNRAGYNQLANQAPQELVQNLNEAARVLRDPRLRRQYDRLLATEIPNF